jgi:hypothetical protein
LLGLMSFRSSTLPFAFLVRCHLRSHPLILLAVLLPFASFFHFPSGLPLLPFALPVASFRLSFLLPLLLAPVGHALPGHLDFPPASPVCLPAVWCAIACCLVCLSATVTYKPCSLLSGVPV